MRESIKKSRQDSELGSSSKTSFVGIDDFILRSSLASYNRSPALLDSMPEQSPDPIPEKEEEPSTEKVEMISYKTKFSSIMNESDLQKSKFSSVINDYSTQPTAKIASSMPEFNVPTARTREAGSEEHTIPFQIPSDRNIFNNNSNM